LVERLGRVVPRGRGRGNKSTLITSPKREEVDKSFDETSQHQATLVRMLARRRNAGPTDAKNEVYRCT
jgi:hypothetical protein